MLLSYSMFFLLLAPFAASLSPFFFHRCIVHRLVPISFFLIFHIDCHPDGEWFRSCFRRFTQILLLVSHFSTRLSSSGFPNILPQMTIGKTYSGWILFLLAKDDSPLSPARQERSVRSVGSPPNFNDDRHCLGTRLPPSARHTTGG